MDSNGGEFADLPPGWMRCDGSVIGHGSIWEGKRVPNLNGEKRFLRGGPDCSVLNMEDDQLQNHEHLVSDPGHTHVYEDQFTVEGINGYRGPCCTDTNHQRFMAPHSKTSESQETGVTVTGVKTGARVGDETRVKNMNIIWIIRVW